MKNKKVLLVMLLSTFLIGCANSSSSNSVMSNSYNSQESNITSSEVMETEYDHVITKEEYFDKVYGGLQAQLWANFTGLPVEFHFIDAPCPKDRIEWVVSNNGYVTDDDTSLEYVITHMMEVNGVDSISYQDVAEEWKYHINDYIWVGNEAARKLMDLGYIPPLTGSKRFNACYRAIDAQIECEVLGHITPGMIINSKQRGEWWARVVADEIAVDCTSFFSSLVSELFFATDVKEAIRNVQKLYTENERINEMVDDIFYLYENYESWRDARQILYRNYYLNNPVKPRDFIDSEINFLMVLLALVYGNNDFDTTGQIALLAGFDNDCTAATSCLMLATMLGYKNLPSDLKEKTGDMYINTNRPGLPNMTLTEYANRICNLGYEVILNKGGKIENDIIYIKDGEHIGNESTHDYSVVKSLDEYELNTEGFQKIYSPSNQNIYSSSKNNDSLTIKVSGSEFAIIGQANSAGGDVEITVDGEKYYATLNLNPTLTLGSYVKILEKHTILRLRNLENKEHIVTIRCLDDRIHTIIGIETYPDEDDYYQTKNVNFSLSKNSKAITSVNIPAGGGSNIIAIIKDGKHYENGGNLTQQYDTFLGYDNSNRLNPHNFEDYFGITFDREVEISKVIFQEGGHFDGGGWFKDGEIRLELKINGKWQTVDSSINPIYPVGNTKVDFGKGGDAYVFTFNRTSCSAFRVIGTPGGHEKFISCGELECYR